MSIIRQTVQFGPLSLVIFSKKRKIKIKKDKLDAVNSYNYLNENLSLKMQLLFWHFEIENYKYGKNNGYSITRILLQYSCLIQKYREEKNVNNTTIKRRLEKEE